MTEPIHIKCQFCGRKAVIEKHDSDERFSRRRWFAVETVWTAFYDTSVRLVCGGNDRDLFVRKGEEFIEVDSCIEKLEDRFGSMVRVFSERSHDRSILGTAHGSRVYHLFVPSLGKKHAPMELLQQVPFFREDS